MPICKGAPVTSTHMAIDRYSYPFTAIVGQEQMKLALVLNAINPSIGGGLIRGGKGNRQSPPRRAPAKILPPPPGVAGAPLGCPPAAPRAGGPACPRRRPPPAARAP